MGRGCAEWGGRLVCGVLLPLQPEQLCFELCLIQCNLGDTNRKGREIGVLFHPKTKKIPARRP